MQRRILRPYSVRVKRIAQLHRRFPGLRAIKDHNVRTNLFGIDSQPRNFRDAFRQPPGILLIDVQSRRRLFQRNQARRSNHARLTHASTEHFPVHPPLLDERHSSRNHRSQRSAQSLRQTKHHRIHFSRHLRDVFSKRRRIHRSPRHVRRVFQAHQRGLRVVINLRPDDRLDLLPRQNPVLAQGHSRHAAGNRRHRSQLIQIHVASLFANHFVAVMRPHFDANEIPHAPGGHKQRRLFPNNLCRALLQAVDRRVFPVNVIPDLRLRHRAPHFRRRPRHRIAPQVHHTRLNLPRLHNLIRIHPLIPLRHCVAHLLLFLVNGARPDRVGVPSASSLLNPFSLLFPAFLRVSRLSLSASVLHYVIASLILYLSSSTNTSFETLNRPGASRTTPPSRSTKPAEANGSNRFASATPYSRSIRATSIPSSCRNPRNNSSSSALCAVSASCCSTGNRPPCTAAT